jgi:CHAD domain-containing protein
MIQPKKFINKRLVELFRIIKQPTANFSNETFHQLRLIIKKLKSFIELVQFSNSLPISIGKPILKIFRISGKIRNLQITIAKFERNCPEKMPNYKLQIEKKIQHLKFHFFKIVAHISLKKIFSTHKKQLIHCKSISYKSANHHINKLKSEIVYKFYTNTEKSKTLHAERILLKKYTYIQKLIHFNTIYQPEMVDLTALLGNWHDNQVIENQLKKSLKSGKIFSTEIDAIKNCLKIINNLKKQLYNQSLKKISTLVVDNPKFLEFHVYI